MYVCIQDIIALMDKVVNREYALRYGDEHLEGRRIQVSSSMYISVCMCVNIIYINRYIQLSVDMFMYTCLRT